MPVSASCRAVTISMGETLSRAFLPVSRVPVTITVSPLSAALTAETGALCNGAVRATDCLLASTGRTVADFRFVALVVTVEVTVEDAAFASHEVVSVRMNVLASNPMVLKLKRKSP